MGSVRALDLYSINLGFFATLQLSTLLFTTGSSWDIKNVHVSRKKGLILQSLTLITAVQYKDTTEAIGFPQRIKNRAINIPYL